MAFTITPPEYTAPRDVIYDLRRQDNMPVFSYEITKDNGVFNEKILNPLAEQLDNKNKSKEYTVKKGDSLWKIAKQQLGDGSRWTEIAEANKLTRNSIIMPGDKLIIPSKQSANQQTTPRKKPTSPTTKTKSQTTPTQRTTTNRPTATTNTQNVTVARLPEYNSQQGWSLKLVPDTTADSIEIISEPRVVSRPAYSIDPRNGQVVAPSAQSQYVPNSTVRIVNTESPAYNTQQASPQPLNFVQQPTSRGQKHVQVVYADPNIPTQPDNWFRNTYLESLLTDSQPLSESIANGSKPLYELYQANPPKPAPKPKRGRNNMDFDWRKYR